LPSSSQRIDPWFKKTDGVSVYGDPLARRIFSLNVFVLFTYGWQVS